MGVLNLRRDLLISKVRFAHLGVRSYEALKFRHFERKVLSGNTFTEPATCTYQSKRNAALLNEAQGKKKTNSFCYTFTVSRRPDCS